MEHTFDGVERTFPKKRSGVGMIGPNSFDQKKKRSMVKTSSRMSASQSRLVMNDDGVTELTTRKKKGSKARQRKRSAKFESKIAAKKAASEAASAATTDGTVSEAGVSDQLKLDPREVDSDAVDEEEEGAEESMDSDESDEGSESIGSSESNSKIISANMRIQQDAGAEDRSENDSSDDSEEESGEEDEEQSEHNEDNEEYEDAIGESGDAFRKEIAAMPMAKVKQLKEKLGLKLFNKAFFGEQSSGENDAQGECSSNTNSNVPMPNKARSTRHFVRDNPKRPREMSSKRPVSKYRNVFANEKIGREKFDPRFDERSGPYDEYIYRKNYEFLDGMRQKEEKILAKEIKKTKQTDPESAEKMKEVLRRMKNHDKSLAEKERNKEVIRELRRENNERMRQGKRPIYLTKGELKMRMMEKKFEELKKTHKLDSYIERKSKKHNLKGNAKPF